MSLAAVGGLLLLLGVLGGRIKERTPVSEPLIPLLAGVLIGPAAPLSASSLVAAHCFGRLLLVGGWVNSTPWVLVIASSGGGVVMFFYSGMLIWLNRRILPEPIKIKGARLIVVSITFAVFAVLSLYTWSTGTSTPP